MVVEWKSHDYRDFFATTCLLAMKYMVAKWFPSKNVHFIMLHRLIMSIRNENFNLKTLIHTHAVQLPERCFRASGTRQQYSGMQSYSPQHKLNSSFFAFQVTDVHVLNVVDLQTHYGWNVPFPIWNLSSLFFVCFSLLFLKILLLFLFWAMFLLPTQFRFVSLFSRPDVSA